jgi:predicted histone-like DNA-binding protein
MAIKFKLTARKNPLDQTAAPKYYAQAQSKGKRDLMSIAKRMAANTTMGIGDIYGVLLTLEQEIGYALEDGITVELGDICFFSPTVQSKGVANISDFNATAHIKKKSVNMRPKKAFVKKMSGIPVEQVL